MLHAVRQQNRRLTVPGLGRGLLHPVAQVAPHFIQFDDTSSLEALRQDGHIGRDVGLDVNSAFSYRPFLNNNVQFKLGCAVLFPGSGLKNLYGEKNLYQVFTNIIFLY